MRFRPPIATPLIACLCLAGAAAAQDGLQDMEVRSLTLPAEPRKGAGVTVTSRWDPGTHLVGVASSDGETVDLPFRELTFLDQYYFEPAGGRITRVTETQVSSSGPGRSSSYTATSAASLARRRDMPPYLGKDAQSVEYAADRLLRIHIEGEAAKMKVFLVKSGKTVDEALNEGMPEPLGSRFAAYSLRSPGSAGALTPVALAADRRGTPHIVYLERLDDGALALRHATRRGSDWKVSTIARPQAPDEISWTLPKAIAVDRKGVAHVAFVDGDESRTLRYATNRWGDWRVEAAAAPAGGARIGIAVDRAGKVHISYAHVGERGPHAVYRQALEARRAAGAPDEGILYATNAGGEWAVEAVELNEFWGQMSLHEVGGYSGLVVDADGTVRVVYAGRLYQGDALRKTGGFLRMSERAPGGGWTRSDIFYQKATHMGDHLAVAADGEGRLHLAYSASGSLGYAEQDEAGAWRFKIPAGHETARAGYVDLALNRIGTPHLVVYGPGKDPTYRYVTRVRDDWKLFSFGQVTPAGERSYVSIPMTGHPAIAIDTAGTRHVAFLRAGEGGVGVLTYLRDR